MPAIRNANHPFAPTSDKQNLPDIILRSCDLVDFYTHKAVLSFASIVFKNMFSFPEPEGEDANPRKDGLAIVQLPESSAALRRVLIICYPRFAASSFDFIGGGNLDGVDEAYDSVDKYEIASGRRELEEILTASWILEHHAYRVFVIACHRGLEHIAKPAATATLKQPPFDPTISIPELKYLSAPQLARFQSYRYGCSKLLFMLLSTHMDYGNPGPYDEPVANSPVWWQAGHAAGCGYDIRYHEEIDEPYTVAPSWLAAHMQLARKACDERPEIEYVVSKVAEISGDTITAISKCSKCVKLAPTQLKEMAAQIEREAYQEFETRRQNMTFAQ